MRKKFQRKLLKAMEKGDCDKVIKMCSNMNYSPELVEEFILRTMFTSTQDDGRDPCD